MWVQLAAAVLGSGVLNAPEAGPPPTMITGPSHGDWNVNLGGSGVAFQGQTVPLLMIGAIALGAIWFLRK